MAPEEPAVNEFHSNVRGFCQFRPVPRGTGNAITAEVKCLTPPIHLLKDPGCKDRDNRRRGAGGGHEAGLDEVSNGDVLFDIDDFRSLRDRPISGRALLGPQRLRDGSVIIHFSQDFV